MKLQSASLSFQRSAGLALFLLAPCSMAVAQSSASSANLPLTQQDSGRRMLREKALLPNDEYKIPLNFDVEGDGVEIKPPVLEWDLTSQSNLKISGSDFNDNTFMIGIYQIGKLDAELVGVLPPRLASEWVMIARWPKALFNIGNLEAISRSGRSLWRQDLNKKDLDQWQIQLTEWRRALRKKVPDFKFVNMPLYETNLALRNFHDDAQPFWTLNEPFRLCLSKADQDGLLTRLCTRYMEIVHLQKGEVAMLPFPAAKQPARVIAFNENAKLQDSRVLPLNIPVQFYAELSSGSSYEFIAKPMSMNLVEMVDIEGTNKAKLIASGPRPNVQVQDVQPEQLGFFENLIGQSWYRTIGDGRKFWQTQILKDQPIFYLPGKGGGLFREEFVITKLPQERIRPYLKTNSMPGTYVDGAKIYGRAPRGIMVSSKMNSIENQDSPNNDFLWKFGAKTRGENNKSYLLVSDGTNTFRAYRELYKGYPGEVSARLTGLLGTGGSFIVLGETAFSYWFESILGWSNRTLSRQRWGISAAFFQSLTPLVFGSNSDALLESTVNLKYRIDPGLWSHDETWGFELSMNQISYSIFQNQLLGAGVFWARSMPKVFDDLMNIVPLMKYPKWVDMEFIYYPITQNPAGIILENFGTGYGNWQLNFHGKVMRTRQFFYEAGFGIKQLDFIQNVVLPGILRERFQFTSFYGTVGLGWSF